MRMRGSVRAEEWACTVRIVLTDSMDGTVVVSPVGTNPITGMRRWRRSARVHTGSIP